MGRGKYHASIEMVGSFAGAFGNPQFLPSVYLRVAVLKGQKAPAPAAMTEQLCARFLDSYTAAMGDRLEDEQRLRARVPVYEIISLIPDFVPWLLVMSGLLLLTGILRGVLAVRTRRITRRSAPSAHPAVSAQSD